MENKIKEYREALNMTQVDLSKKAEISRNLISLLENGEDVNITKKTMIQIANALNASVTDIFLF